MLALMGRISISLPEDIDLRLRHEAQLRNMTISEITREAIAAFLDEETAIGSGQGKRRRLLGAKAGSSGQSDISERIEQILRTEMTTR